MTISLQIDSENVTIGEKGEKLKEDSKRVAKKQSSRNTQLEVSKPSNNRQVKVRKEQNLLRYLSKKQTYFSKS